jgi:hypothetical protein
VGQPSDVQRTAREPRAGADDRRLFGVGQPRIGEPQACRIDEADRALEEPAADVLVDDRGLADIAGPSLTACGRLVLPGDMHMRLRMPQLVLCRLIAVPAEPPVDHRRRDAGHVGQDGDSHAAVGRQGVAVLESLAIAHQARARLGERRQHRRGQLPPLQRGGAPVRAAAPAADSRTWPRAGRPDRYRSSRDEAPSDPSHVGVEPARRIVLRPQGVQPGHIGLGEEGRGPVGPRFSSASWTPVECGDMAAMLSRAQVEAFGVSASSFQTP